MVEREVLDSGDCLGCTSGYREEIVLSEEIMYQEFVSCRRCWRDFGDVFVGRHVSGSNSVLSGIHRFIVVWTSSDYERRLNRVMALRRFFHAARLGVDPSLETITFKSVERSGDSRRVRRFVVHPESSYLENFSKMEFHVNRSFDEGNLHLFTSWIQQVESRKWFDGYTATIDWNAVGEILDAPPPRDYVPGSLFNRVVDTAVLSAVPVDLKERFGSLHGAEVERWALRRVYEQLATTFPGNVVAEIIRERMVAAGVGETALMDWDAWVHWTRRLRSAESADEMEAAEAEYRRYLAVRHRELDHREELLDIREKALSKGLVLTERGTLSLDG